MNRGQSFPENLLNEQPEASESDSSLCRNNDHHGCRTPSLSVDSGTYSVEPPQLLDNSENFRPDSMDLCDQLDTNGFSEEELLNYTFEACDTAGRGEVLASTVVQYLRAMTGHSPGQDKLTILQRMLDPQDADATVSRDAFHTTMRKWITQCSQERVFDDSYRSSGADATKSAGNGSDYTPLTETTFTEQAECHRESSDLLGLVSELKYAQHRLSRQNRSLLRTVAQCEEANLQLTLEVSELRSKLASAQLSVVRARSLSEELDEARRGLRESQEKASRAQTSRHALIKESEHLKARIKVIEDKNEKLLHERNCAEDRLNKLKRANTDIREALEETRVLLEGKEREITRKNFILQKLKDTFLEHHKIVESLQSELMRLQEHSQQALLRFDKCPESLPGLNRGGVPNNFSLHHEILEAQPQGTPIEDSSTSVLPPSTQRGTMRTLTHKIKSADLKQLLHTHISERDAVCSCTTEMLERALQQGQQQQTISKQQLLTILRELDLLRAPLDEQGGKLSPTDRQTHDRSTETAITWQRALRLEGLRRQTDQEAQEACKGLEEKIQILEANLRATQWELTKSREKAALQEQEIRELREAQRQARMKQTIETKDRSVETELTGDVSSNEAESHRIATENLLKSLKRVEAVVGKALQAAQLLNHSEKRVKERLEAIGFRVEEALNRAALTESQLRALEGRVPANKPFLDVSARSDVMAVNANCPVLCSGNTTTYPEPSSLNPSSMTDGGSPLCTGAEDNNHKSYNDQEISQDTSDPSRNPHADLSGSWVNCSSVVISEPSGSDLPVGAVSKQSPREENVGVSCDSVHSPFPETSPGPACEELERRHTRQNVAGSEKPDCSNGFQSVSAESELCGAVLEEADSSQNSRPKGNKCLKYKQDNSGETQEESARCRETQEESAKCGSPELELSSTQRLGEDEQRAGPEHCGSRREAFKPPYLGLSEGETKSSRRSKEESEASRGGKDETENRSLLNEPKESWMCYTSGLSFEKEEHSASSSGGSVQVSQLQTADSAQTLQSGQHTNTVCGTTGPNPLSPKTPERPAAESPTPFVFPHTRSRPPTTPAMPTLPEEEEDSPEEIDSSSSSPSSYMPVETKLVNVTISPPAIVLPRQVSKQEPRPLEKARPHSPRPRSPRNTGSSGPITTVDVNNAWLDLIQKVGEVITQNNDGHVIDLVKDKLPELQLSEEDRQKNLELLEEAKKVSDRFLTRRGRRSTCSLTDSPTALSPNPTPGSSPSPSRSSSISAPPQIEVTTSTPASPAGQRLEVPPVRDHAEANKPDKESLKRLVDWKPPEKRKVSSGTLTPRHGSVATPKEHASAQKGTLDSRGPVDRGKKASPAAAAQKPDNQTPATGVAKPVPRPPTQQAPCTAEIKTIGAFPPLMRAVSWDTVGTMNMRNGAPKDDESLLLSDQLKSSGYKDFPVPPVQKLSKMREEHKLMRNQSISGSKLPELSEMAEQERGPFSPTTSSSVDEEAKEKADAMPNISDIMLRKLKLHRGLPGCAPPLTEKEVENAFVQLSLAFRNDNYTLETRLKQAERERNLTEENTEKELEEFKNSLKSTVSLWQNAEQRESYQRLVETVAVLNRLANRLSSRAEMVGAVRQERRMNKATEVMLQYVENLKRTYEKDHAELMEFKKLANQNSNRCYVSSLETGDDGSPRPSRSMSLTMGKALPRRRVSVAVVPKFNLLNIPGQTPATSSPVSGPSASIGPAAAPSVGPGTLPVLCEANIMKSDAPSDTAQQTTGENGKGPAEQEGEAPTLAKASCSLEEIRAELKAKIEEEAYNKGYQEGLKKIKELQEVKEEEEKAEEKAEEITEEEPEQDKKPNSRYEVALEVLDRICPKVFKQNRRLWMALFLVFCFLLSLLNFFSSGSDHADTSAEKSGLPGKKKFLGLHVGSKAPSTE